MLQEYLLWVVPTALSTQEAVHPFRGPATHLGKVDSELISAVPITPCQNLGSFGGLPKAAVVIEL